MPCLNALSALRASVQALKLRFQSKAKGVYTGKTAPVEARRLTGGSVELEAVATLDHHAVLSPRYLYNERIRPVDERLGLTHRLTGTR